MKHKYSVLSVAIAAILAGCGGGTTPEKKVELAPQESIGNPVTTVEAAPAVQAKPKPVDAQTEIAPVARSAAAPDEPKRELKIPTDPNTYLITAETKTREHPYYGMGKSEGFVVNGKQGAEIVVDRGEEYKFIVDTGVQHDFYLTSSPVGWGAGTYTDGVQGQFIYHGEVTFSPGKTTPDLLYYQCRNHKYMGGKIFVLDKGENLAEVKAALAVSDEKPGGARRSATVVSESAIKQKLAYAKMVLGSKSAQRIEESGNAAAIKLLNDARGQIDAANVSFDGGNLEQSMDQVNEGIRLMTAASRQITTESEMTNVDHKVQYDELSNSLNTYEASYKRNLERAAKTVKATLDQTQYDALVKDGHALAESGDYAAANESLQKAQGLITTALTNMLNAQTVTYDNKFETPQEEYEYELARMESYEELVPLAIEQKQPTQNALELIDSFVKKAAKIKAEGKDVAAKGDYKMAIMAMQAATSNLQRALRIAGVN